MSASSCSGRALPGRRRTSLPWFGSGRPMLLAVLALAAVLAACSAAPIASPISTPFATESALPPATGSPSPSASPAFPMNLTDDEGNPLSLETLPARIVSLTPGTTEIAYALGVGSRVVAVTASDDYPPAVKQLPKVATFDSVDVEKIVGLRPDVVLAGGKGFNKPDALQKLRDLGIPVLIVYASDVPGVLADIRLVGRALGEADRANQLAAAMQGRLAAISAAAKAAGPAPRVFYELDATNQIFGPAANSFVAGMISMAGGTPITTGDPNVYSMSLEKLVAADPQVILLGDAAYGTTPAQVEKRPGWASMTAVRTRAIRPVDDTVITRPGPRLADGLADLALAIHPGLSVPQSSPLPTWVSPSAP